MHRVPTSCALLAVATLGCSPLGPSPVEQRIDVLDYLVGDDALWPRHGDQLQDQITSESQVCWVKYGRSEMYECWRWDEQWVYHVIDHALDGDSGESYSFTDGRWLPRYLDGAWSLDLAENRIRWRAKDCRPMRAREGIPCPSDVHAFPYHLSVRLEPHVAIGGDLGTRDVLVLSYAPYAPGGKPRAPEEFRFARGAGWYRWDSPRGNRVFDRVGGVRVMPSWSCL